MLLYIHYLKFNQWICLTDFKHDNLKQIDFNKNKKHIDDHFKEDNINALNNPDLFDSPVCTGIVKTQNKPDITETKVRRLPKTSLADWEGENYQIVILISK